MITHEVSHGLVALALGDRTAKDSGRLTFNPLAHVDPFMSIILPAICIFSGAPVLGGAKPVPIDESKLKGGEWGTALVSLAGPVSNLLMVIISFISIHIMGYDNALTTTFLLPFISVNISLAVFNLLPIPPLDGSKVITPIAPDFIKNIFHYLERNSLYSLILICALSSAIIPMISSIQSIIFQFFVGFFIG